MKRVLFVCTGNTCRSPMAEAIFRELVRERADYEVASAGVGAYEGDAPSLHTVEALRDHGLDIAHFRSQPLSTEIIEKSTHIFAMTYGHLRTLEMMFPSATEKLYLVTEFCPEDSLRGRDLPDPFGGPKSGYDQTRDVLMHVLPSLVAYIDQTFDRIPQAPAPHE